MYVQTGDDNHPKYKTPFVVFSVANKNDFINLPVPHPNDLQNYVYMHRAVLVPVPAVYFSIRGLFQDRYYMKVSRS